MVQNRKQRINLSPIKTARELQQAGYNQQNGIGANTTQLKRHCLEENLPPQRVVTASAPCLLQRRPITLSGSFKTSALGPLELHRGLVGSLIGKAWAPLVSANAHSGIKTRAKHSFVNCQNKQVRNLIFYSSDVAKRCGSKGTTFIAITSPTLQALAPGKTTLKQKLANAQRVEVNRETIEGNDIPWSPACKESVPDTVSLSLSMALLQKAGMYAENSYISGICW